jgi:hypothetical protein
MISAIYTECHKYVLCVECRYAECRASGRKKAVDGPGSGRLLEGPVLKQDSL